MIPGCTNTLEFEIDDETVDLTQASQIYVSIKQGIHNIVKTGDSLDVTATTISVGLTQEETLRLQSDTPAEVQVNWIYNDARGYVQRAATDPATIDIGTQLLPRVLP